ncbi:hypothetical protein RM423_23245 [Jatrophihabitans sp. DSM 44399]|uniref:Uncharacterized protein n=1 Tax=Jatrophihabitans lederbergiae TaxID=3075547 RepID=A0ABU2JH15_9ACTN|nr:hypothetical protein [Jatrophihabitans sp. DSM 44399]
MALRALLLRVRVTVALDDRHTDARLSALQAPPRDPGVHGVLAQILLSTTGPMAAQALS